MKPILTLVKNPENVDSNYFGFEKIYIYAFNFDAEGTALLSYDDAPDFDTMAGIDLYHLLCGNPGDGTRWYRPETEAIEAMTFGPQKQRQGHMDEVKFWALVQSAHDRSGGDMDQKCELIRIAVATLPSDDAISFWTTFNSMMNKGYEWPLWSAADIIRGFCSDDSFIDFRASLISRGREAFVKAMDNPDSLATEEFDEEAWFYEGYQYAVSDGVEAAVGSVPTRTPYPTEPSSKRLKRDDVFALLPQLCRKFAFRAQPEH